MAELRVESARLTDDYARLLAAQGVMLPLSASVDDVGTVTDSGGNAVFVVDQHRELPDEQVFAIASWIVLAVNTCGGLVLGRVDAADQVRS